MEISINIHVKISNIWKEWKYLRLKINSFSYLKYKHEIL